MKNRKQVETRSFDPSGHARPTEPAPSSLESLSSQGTVVPELVAAAALFARGRSVDEGRIAELVGVSVLELLHPDQRRMADDLPNILFREASAGPNDLSHLAFSRVAPTTHLGQLEDIVRVAGRVPDRQSKLVAAPLQRDLGSTRQERNIVDDHFQPFDQPAGHADDVLELTKMGGGSDPTESEMREIVGPRAG
ncbi:MAG: hypothetical protein AAFZ18_38570, partial [Myxococcota bacterium]